MQCKHCLVIYRYQNRWRHLSVYVGKFTNALIVKLKSSIIVTAAQSNVLIFCYNFNIFKNYLIIDKNVFLKSSSLILLMYTYPSIALSLSCTCVLHTYSFAKYYADFFQRLHRLKNNLYYKTYACKCYNNFKEVIMFITTIGQSLQLLLALIRIYNCVWPRCNL